MKLPGLNPGSDLFKTGKDTSLGVNVSIAQPRKIVKGIDEKFFKNPNIGGLFRQSSLYAEPLNHSTSRRAFLLPAHLNYRRHVFSDLQSVSLAADRNEADYAFDFYKAVPTTNSNISSLSLIEPFEISYIFPVLHTTVFLLCINAQPHSGISTSEIPIYRVPSAK